MQKIIIKKVQTFAIIFLFVITTIVPITYGINISKNTIKDNGIWERIEYGEYPCEEPDGLGNYYLSANCSVGQEASYITKEINLDGLSIATIGFSYYFSGHGVAIVGIYSGGHGMNYWEETIFFLQSSSPSQIDDFETTIFPDSYSDPSEVYLEFYYFNDYGQTFPGFSIDDVYINEIGYFDSFEVNDGTLSGYVTDPLLNPINGALIRVYFHGTYEEDYSDENGYYHVTNIPICYCMKNCTCSKEGFKTEWVLMGISENSTYDFMLYPLDVYPVFNGSQCNGWWNSPVTISFVYDPDIVSEIWYNYHGWHLYTEPFVVNDEGPVIIKYYWIDFEGIQSAICTFEIVIDFTPPIFEVFWEAYKENTKWYVKFDITAEDPISGMDSYLFFYVNDILQLEFEVLDWSYVYISIPLPKNFKHYKFGFGCSDIACNNIIKNVNGSDIKDCSFTNLFRNLNLYNILLSKFMKHFPILFSIIKKYYF